MARSPAADLHFDLHWGEVELVVKDRERVQIELVEFERLLDRVAAVIHEGLRLHEQDSVFADPPFSDEASELLLPGTEIVRHGEHIGGHEADVVPLKRIFGSGISEADPKLHRGSLAGA